MKKRLIDNWWIKFCFLMIVDYTKQIPEEKSNEADDSELNKENKEKSDMPGSPASI